MVRLAQDSSIEAWSYMVPAYIQPAYIQPVDQVREVPKLLKPETIRVKLSEIPESLE